MNPILLVTLAAFALLAWKDHRKAFLLFVAALPAYVVRFKIGNVPTTALEALFAILFFAWMCKREKRLIDIKGWGWLLLAWITVATISLFVSPDFRAAAGVWKAYFIEPILFFLIASDLMRTQDDRDNVVRSLAWSAIGVATMAILQHWTNWGVPPPWNLPGQERSTSIYGYPNAIGLFLAPLMPLFLKKKPLHLTALALSTLAIVFAQTEGAIVGLLAGFGVYLLCFKKTRRVALCAGGIAALIILATPKLRTFAIEKLTLSDWSGRVRKEMWIETSHMLKDHAVLGAGLSGYPKVFDAYHKARHIEIFQYPHNILLNFWVETGLAGIAVFIMLIVRFVVSLRETFRKDSSMRVWVSMLLASMTTLLVHGLVDVPYFKNDLSLLFWLLLALAGATLAQVRSIDKRTKN